MGNKATFSDFKDFLVYKNYITGRKKAYEPRLATTIAHLPRLSFMYTHNLPPLHRTASAGQDGSWDTPVEGKGGFLILSKVREDGSCHTLVNLL